MAKIEYDPSKPDLELMKRIAFEPLRNEKKWDQLDKTGDGFDPYVDYPSGRVGEPMTKARALREAKLWLRGYTDESGGGLYAAPLRVNNYYEVELGVPSSGQLTYTPYDQLGNPIGVSVSVDIATLNGAAWFEERIRIHGILDGQLTIGVNGSIEITDDILYDGGDSGIGSRSGLQGGGSECERR